ncbi:MAG: cyanophycinase [Ardenticatenales bacterium]
MTRGFTIPIGGAEEKIRTPDILSRFVALCGGERARIVVVPTASMLPTTGRKYEIVFKRLGVADVTVVPMETRADAARARNVDALDGADGVFMTGGNQLRLSTTLGGTPFADRMRHLHAHGLHVAGTSAGAAVMSAHMIAFGDDGPTPRADMVTLAPGFGFTDLAIIDQHFRQRDRIGRLLTALSYNPSFVGVGLDEDTAAFIGPDDVLTVAGSGAITVVDPSDVSFTSLDSANRHDPVSILGVRLHVLTDGAKYDLMERRATPPSVRADLPPVGEAKDDVIDAAAVREAIS